MDREREVDCTRAFSAAAAVAVAGRELLWHKTPPTCFHMLPTPQPVPRDENHSTGEIVIRDDLIQ